MPTGIVNISGRHPARPLPDALWLRRMRAAVGIRPGPLPFTDARGRPRPRRALTGCDQCRAQARVAKVRLPSRRAFPKIAVFSRFARRGSSQLHFSGPSSAPSLGRSSLPHPHNQHPDTPTPNTLSPPPNTTRTRNRQKKTQKQKNSNDGSEPRAGARHARAGCFGRWEKNEHHTDPRYQAPSGACQILLLLLLLA